MSCGLALDSWIVSGAQWGYRCGMRSQSSKTILVFFAAFVVLSACTSEKLYVFNKDEFNRNSPSFNKKPDDISKIEICYNKTSTTPEAVIELARKECGNYGKQARFHKQDILHCPLYTPIRATFLCLDPKK